MIRILLVNSDKDSFSELAPALEENRVHISWAESGTTALSKIADETFDLAITDERLSDMTGLEFAEKLVSINPMMNCAVASSLSSGDFHEASEGLGILMQLTRVPDKTEAEKLLEHLNNILTLINMDRKV